MEQAQLQDLLERQKSFHEAQAQLIRLRLEAVRSPSPANDAAVETFGKLVVKPMRKNLVEYQVERMQRAIDVDGLKSFAPAILAGLMQYVDIEALLTIMGIDQDVIMDFIHQVKQYISEL